MSTLNVNTQRVQYNKNTPNHPPACLLLPHPLPPLSAREVISRRLKTKIGKAEEQIGEEGRQSRQSRQAGTGTKGCKSCLVCLTHTHSPTDTLTYVTHRIGWGFLVAPEPGYRLSPTSLSPHDVCCFCARGTLFLSFGSRFSIADAGAALGWQ